MPLPRRLVGEACHLVDDDAQSLGVVGPSPQLTQLRLKLFGPLEESVHQVKEN